MVLLTTTCLAAFAAALSLTAVVRAAARRWCLVDHPDGKRKLHDRPKPILGGVAIYAAMAIALLAIRFVSPGATPELSELSTAWMIAAGFVCLVGCIDDIYNLNPRLKLALQIVSVLPIVLLGDHIDRVVAFGCPIHLGWLSVPLTVFWLVGCINALNLIDGMDGLASIVGLATATMLGVIAVNEGHPHVATIAVILAGALAGFLIYNLPPASIFLGDSGSMVIGLTVGVLGIAGTMKTSATLAITAPAVVMTLPMFDIAAALVRRRLTGRRFDSPDRLHIHHRLLARGWTPWQVLSLLGALCLTTGAAATAATILRRDALAWIVAIVLVVLLIRLRLFGYEEFALAKNALSQRLAGLRNLLWRQSEAATTAGRVDLDALSGSEAWELLVRDVPQWQIRKVELTLADRESPPRQIRWLDPTMPRDRDCHWSLAVSLPSDRGNLCELRVASVEVVTSGAGLASLTSLLRTFGAHFARHADQMFTPLAIVGDPETPKLRRKAA